MMSCGLVCVVILLLMFVVVVVMFDGIGMR